MSRGKLSTGHMGQVSAKLGAKKAPSKVVRASHRGSLCILLLLLEDIVMGSESVAVFFVGSDCLSVCVQPAGNDVYIATLKAVIALVSWDKR